MIESHIVPPTSGEEDSKMEVCDRFSQNNQELRFRVQGAATTEHDRMARRDNDLEVVSRVEKKRRRRTKNTEIGVRQSRPVCMISRSLMVHPKRLCAAKS